MLDRICKNHWFVFLWNLTNINPSNFWKLKNKKWKDFSWLQQVNQQPCTDTLYRSTIKIKTHLTCLVSIHYLQLCKILKYFIYVWVQWAVLVHKNLHYNTADLCKLVSTQTNLSFHVKKVIHSLCYGEKLKNMKA